MTEATEFPHPPLFGADELREIAARASTIDERIFDGYMPAKNVDEPKAAIRLEAWRQSSTRGDHGLFCGVLASLQHDEQSVLPFLGRVQLARNSVLPRWLETFSLLTEDLNWQPLTPSPRVDCAEARNSIPFEELLWPVVVRARQLLARRLIRSSRELMSKAAWLDLDFSLLRRLSDVCAQALLTDFSQFRYLTRFRPDGPVLPFWLPQSRVIYDEYLKQWAAERCRSFFLQRPVAARLIGTVVSNWVVSSAELIGRLERDLGAISAGLLGGVEPGPVIHLDSDLSDLHHSGRTVVILEFSNERRIVYKPKDLHVDCAWTELLNWLAINNAPTRLKAVMTLPREGYGWAEFISIESPSSYKDRKHFYQQAGMLLSVLRALCGTDFHRANIIDQRNGPVPIDFETLLQPSRVSWESAEIESSADACASMLLRCSVLNTLYLPSWASGLDGQLWPRGGLDEIPDRSNRHPYFHDVNTDAMRPAESPAADPSPVSGGDKLAAYLPDIVEGFAEAHAFLLSHRDRLTAVDGPLERFRKTSLRVVIAATATYGRARRIAQAYENLGDGVDWSLHFYSLAQDFQTGSDVPAQRWSLFSAERRALANGDIPYFSVCADGTTIKTCSGDRVPDGLLKSPIEQTLARLAELSDSDKLLQERLIRTSIQIRAVDAPAEKTERTLITDSALHDVALAIAATLERCAIRQDNAATWIGLTLLDHEHRHISGLGVDLYAGSTGVAVFLAALAHASGTRAHRELALCALAPARRLAARMDGGRAVRAIGPGGTQGAGSVIYGLVLAARFLDEGDLMTDARHLASFIDESCISNEESFDVMSGAAGTILALLALHDACGDEVPLERAAACGRYLLKGLSDNADGEICWNSIRGRRPMRAGFLSGVSGLILALLRLHRATGERSLLDAANAVIDYDRRSLMPTARNSLDLRGVDDSVAPRMSSTWCHGMAGTGLGRLGYLDLIDDPELGVEIDTALATTAAVPITSLDSLCCGNLGRVDFQLSAGVRLNRPQLLQSARERAALIVSRADRRGAFALPGADTQLNPGLFSGIAGIGYELLRLTDPSAYSSILLWE